MSENGFLLIADISGYTEFVKLHNLAKKPIFGGLGKLSKMTMKLDPWRGIFETDSGPIFQPKIVPKSVQNRIQEGSSEKCKNRQNIMCFS